MISLAKRRGIVFICLFLSLFLNSCTTPEDNAIKPLQQNVPLPDSTQALISNAPLPGIYTIEISGMKFKPDVITVNKGDTLIWKNNDLVTHCVTEVYTTAWTSSKIAAGESWKMAVNNSYDYFCAIHMVMKGKIIVK